MSESRKPEDIRAWLIEALAELLEVAPGQVDCTRAFASYGLGSTEAVIFAGDLEDWLGFEIPPRVVFDYPNIDALSQHLGSLS